MLGLVPSLERYALAFQHRHGVRANARSCGISCRRATRSRCLVASTRCDATEHRRRIDMLVALFELAPLVDTPVRQLSLGERMRCEIAASLLHTPQLLFLDEPTIGLDVSAKATIRELLRTESDRQGVTLLLTSHDTGDIERVCGSRDCHPSRPAAVGRHARRPAAKLPHGEAHHAVDRGRAHRRWKAGVRVISSHSDRTELEVDADVTSLGPGRRRRAATERDSAI